MIQQLLEEFNFDVFQGRGNVCENSYGETSYLLLETKNGCLYVFPLTGDELVFKVYRSKIEKEHLSTKSKVSIADDGNLVGAMRVKIGLFEKDYAHVKYYSRECLAEVLRQTYHDYWMSLLV